MKHWSIVIIFSTIILLLHYLVKCRSRSLAVYKFTTMNAYRITQCISSENHFETTKLLKICQLLNTKHIQHHKGRRTEMMHQQQVACW